jgi:hypothetical protein
MRSALVGLVAALLVATPASAQHFNVGAGYALTDYREQADFLHFRGSGPTAFVTAERGRLSMRVEAAHLNLDPASDGPATLESFTADQIAIRAGVRAVSFVVIEGGYLKRSTAPGRAAQSYSAATLGVRAAYPLAPGADVALRTAYVAGTGFSGGGSAPFGIELGLSASYAPGSSRLRLTGDFDFQRIDRRTDQNGGRLSVPIQSSVARMGLAVKF